MKREDFEKISTYEGPERSPGFLLWHISTSWRSSIEQSLKVFNLTHPQFVILACLGWLTREGDQVKQSAVGRMACLDPNTTSQIIRGLEKKKLIIRRKSSDARVKNPLLTEEGRSVLAKALPAVEEKDMCFFEVLSNSDMSSLLSIFQKLIVE
ncbi:MAG: MarR family transcriptional regulator [Chlamydiota bacterium]|nr:MarR family transcriptional regulator [Chlamydiota bacterium]